MGFLDNSRDIVIDAVLTDLGRRRLAEGNFRIVRFGLGDDEINYKLFDPNHPSGSAYYDLDVLQTPVFEAFTNNISTMNSRLVTYNNNTLLYLPILKLNTYGIEQNTAVNGTNPENCGLGTTDFTGLGNVFLIAVDDRTQNALGYYNVKQYMPGYTPLHKNYIRIDQGIDNAAMTNTVQLEQTLIEDVYTVEIDNRFGFVNYNNVRVNPTFVDDDDVALYTFSLLDSRIQNVKQLAPFNTTVPITKYNYSIRGARGTCLSFGIFATPELQNNTNYWFDKVGTSVDQYGETWKLIHSTITVTGLKTGYSIDIPVTFIKTETYTPVYY